MRELAEALRVAAEWAENDAQSLNDFHAYAQRYGCNPGANVYTFVLADALRFRGITIDRLRGLNEAET